MTSRATRNGRFWSLVVVVATALAGLLPACSTADGDPVSTSPNARESFLKDGALRPVRMASGRALSYVLPTTGSQILCQALPEARWEELLGGRVGRWPSRPPAAGCQINDQRGFVVMQLRGSDEALAVEATVAGRPMRVERNDREATEVTVGLTDEVLRPATRHRPTRDLLTFRSAYHGDPRAELALVTRALEELVPVLAAERESLPAIDDQGRIAYTSTPLTSGTEFIDLPTPVQALQLCTLLREESSLDVRAGDLVPADRGECQISGDGDGDDNVTVAVDASPDEPAAYQSRIAGRPAMIGDAEVYTLVRLRDDVYVDLAVYASNSAELAEELVPLLTG
jgi:hypothetical protein